MKALAQALLLCLTLLALTLSFSAAASTQDSVKEWKFRVLLDGKDIGHHHFTLIDKGMERHIESEANFDARVFMLFRFQYQHSNAEVWQGNCLVEINSETNTNGKTISMQGYRDADAFVVATDQEEQRLPECVKSFAYWNAQILNEARLINQQTGRYQEINIAPLASESLMIRGENVSAQRYRLTGEKIDLDIWYSDTGEWLQLESKVKGGRTIRYQLT